MRKKFSLKHKSPEFLNVLGKLSPPKAGNPRPRQPQAGKNGQNSNHLKIQMRKGAAAGGSHTVLNSNNSEFRPPAPVISACEATALCRESLPLRRTEGITSALEYRQTTCSGTVCAPSPCSQVRNSRGRDGERALLKKIIVVEGTFVNYLLKSRILAVQLMVFFNAKGMRAEILLRKNRTIFAEGSIFDYISGISILQLSI